MDVTDLAVALLCILVAFEAKAWFPPLLRWLIRLSIARLPKRQRARFQEEWSAHIDEVPGALVKFVVALGFVVASRRMFPRWQRALAYRRARSRDILARRATLRVMDLFVAILSLLTAGPLLILIFCATALSGSPIAIERRWGRAGRPFVAYKFRTVKIDEYGNLQATGLGIFLRKTALNELPLIINVLRGEMSYIGSHNSSLESKPGLLGISCPTTTSPKPVVHCVISTVLWYVEALSRGMFRAFFDR